MTYENNPLELGLDDDPFPNLNAVEWDVLEPEAAAGPADPRPVIGTAPVS